MCVFPEWYFPLRFLGNRNLSDRRALDQKAHFSPHPRRSGVSKRGETRFEGVAAAAMLLLLLLLQLQ